MCKGFAKTAIKNPIFRHLLFLMVPGLKIKLPNFVPRALSTYLKHLIIYSIIGLVVFAAIVLAVIFIGNI